MKYFTPVPATLEELKALYRKLAMKHHPDLGGDTETMKANSVFTSARLLAALSRSFAIFIKLLIVSPFYYGFL